MKSTHKVVRFDYSKFESENPWDHDALYEYEFWGFHKKRGRMHIDTKRYKKACKIVGIDDFMPSGLFAPRNTVYFIPKRKNRFDYKVNIFRDLISSLKNEWVEEYKPLFNKIKSPKEVYEESRLNAIACTSCSDDYDEIDFEARMAALRRESSYAKIINACYCMFLQKLVTEIDRYTLMVMVDCGYKEDDFSFESFLGFTAKITGNDEPKSLLTKFSGFNCYNLLRKIKIFLSTTAFRLIENSKKHTRPMFVRLRIKRRTQNIKTANLRVIGLS